MRLRAIVLVAAVGAGTFVLGSQLAAGAGSPAPDLTPACSLITKSEAQDALGHAVNVSDNGKACGFTVTEHGKFRSLSVQLGPDGISAESFGEAVAGYAKAANASVRQVWGVGDSAWATLGAQISQVIARQGETFVSIIFINVNTPAGERVAAMSDLARRALGRVS